MYGDTMSNPHVDSFTLPLTTARPLEGNRVEKTRSCTCDCGGRGVNGVRVEGGRGGKAVEREMGADRRDSSIYRLMTAGHDRYTNTNLRCFPFQQCANLRENECGCRVGV